MYMRGRMGPAVSGKGIIMFTRSIAGRQGTTTTAWRAPLGVVLAIGVIVPLTACQPVATVAPADGPAVAPAQVPADRLDGRLAQQRALTERFAGQPQGDVPSIAECRRVLAVTESLAQPRHRMCSEDPNPGVSVTLPERHNDRI